MKKEWKLLLVLFALVLLLGGAYVLYDRLGSGYSGGLVEEGTKPPEETDDTAPGSDKEDTELFAAPDFSVTDTDGNAVRLTDKIGKPVVLNFWASWCPPCKAEMPDFNEAYEEWGDTVAFMMVNMTDGGRETVETAKSFIEKEGFSFPVYFDTEYEAAIAYSATSLPVTYFIDADGYLIARAMGMIDAETLEKGIGLITGE